MRTLPRSRSLLVTLPFALAALGACASAAPLRAAMEPLPLAAIAPAPAPLEEDFFVRDKMALADDDLRTILRAPAYLEEHARIGIVTVSSGYAVDADLPTTAVPGVLADQLEDSGHFEIVSEVSTDWPSASGLSGLRELAARYRAEYLLLYRHRFVDRSYTNAWALGWITIVGAFFLPHNTIETAGVVEATLFDVKSGTLLFTVFDRVQRTIDTNVWQNDRKRRRIKEELLSDATKSLTEHVLNKVRLLVVARPERPSPTAPALVVPPRTPAPLADLASPPLPVPRAAATAP
ncbi:MAG: hypothetical protein CVU56_25965 [Deltaproteobacteria bacterium HGW-Deltaproteobacteria-14]|jgi:hypothetical protein|nr:MAG: hypothetical protein CVU56_25965 [Deltaproteobacteria bacterium HGW-Deltaproteobacteria-14]